MTGSRWGFQYVVLRCVPRVDREEFLNVAVILYCQGADFLDCAGAVDADRLTAFSPLVDVSGVTAAVDMAAAVCRGEAVAGSAALAAPGTRFGFLSAPRSTVVQPGPVHGGLTGDPAGDLVRLVRTLVHPGPGVD